MEFDHRLLSKLDDPLADVDAERLDAALVIIGSHGYGGLDRVIGTTAARVVNHADRTVVVVRPPQ
jgi:nucleotide-binding universal stress UspA family protein